MEGDEEGGGRGWRCDDVGMMEMMGMGMMEMMEMMGMMGCGSG